jgi:8-oxo-dGTP diphosphatase/2-hydroxy-dATP diphosphatase
VGADWYTGRDLLGMNRKLLTLAFAIEDGRILLGMKKRGLGKGRWNGFGGKVQDGESIAAAAKRETAEECGIAIMEMEKVGIHEFEFESERGTILEVHVFRITRFAGTPVETEEMCPHWFSLQAIPYDDMWADDRYWLPLFLAGKKFRTKILFGGNDSVLEQEIRVVR